MKVVHQFEELATVERPLVLAIGFFDGVHRGHQAVVARAVEEARRLNGEAWVLTFSPHPLKVIRPDSAPPMLTSTPHKLYLLKPLGIDGCILLPFTPELRDVSAEDFLERLRGSIPGLKHVVVGSNWSFGHERAGCPGLLEKTAAGYHVSVSTIPAVTHQGTPISSTRIRKAVTNGDLAKAAELLGRPFSIWGDVVEGRKIGRELGFPTANIDPHNEVHPPSGIYAVCAALGDTIYKGAAYVGSRPTFESDASTFVVEVYLFDIELDLYGRELEVLFIERIRGDRTFPSPGELSVQIAEDIRKARAILADGNFQRF